MTYFHKTKKKKANLILLLIREVFFSTEVIKTNLTFVLVEVKLDSDFLNNISSSSLVDGKKVVRRGDATKDQSSSRMEINY